ncbi:MAG TPA: hypothetical protein PLI08_02875 [Bacteroidia bacterium]|nr:hypothetical protein [Bacteroidia bacterium]
MESANHPKYTGANDTGLTIDIYGGLWTGAAGLTNGRGERTNGLPVLPESGSRCNFEEGREQPSSGTEWGWAVPLSGPSV